MIKRLIRIAVAAALLATSFAMAQALPAVPGERAWAPKAAAPAPRLHISEQATPQKRALRMQTELSPIADSEIEAVRRANRRARAANANVNAKRFVIGVSRSTGDATLAKAADLAWIDVDGGRAAQAAVTSPAAAALRLAIDLAGVPADVEMVFFGSAAATRLVGPIRVGDIADRTSSWWSPLTEGDTQTVEFFVPGDRDAQRLPIRVVNVSHLFASPADGFRKRVQEIGASSPCNIDVACTSLNYNPSFLHIRESVAQMVSIDGSFAVLCTGTLLNDTDGATQVPWFYSANHCFDNESLPYKTPAQMQTVANTLTTLWDFEADQCQSTTVSPRYQQVAGGSQLVYNNPQADVLFLRLNSAPPANAFFGGWDPNPISPGASVIVVHHPQGDLKKISQGSVTRLWTPGIAGGSNQFIEARWSSGLTEPGSSGAGLWSYNGSEYLFRGGEWGGSDQDCANLRGTDQFSRFDQIYPTLAPYLNPGAAPSADYTDLWWNPAESGWGLNLIQHPSRKIFGVWYTYREDGKRIWYVMSDGAWTSTNVYTGPLYVTSGSPFNEAFDPNRLAVDPVGTGTLTFSDANHGTWSFSVNGITGTKAIERQPF
jgi:hypothetical protein